MFYKIDLKSSADGKRIILVRLENLLCKQEKETK